jgi:hypothetical protein
MPQNRLYCDVGRWGHPPLPFQKDRHRWQRFCREIEQRIQEMRAAEGFDGRTTNWCAFDPPLPARAPLPFRSYRPRIVPPPTLPRDAHGRLMARRQEAS